MRKLGIGSTGAGRRHPFLLLALGALLAASGVGSGDALTATWPEPPADPIPPEATPETAGPAAVAVDDSIRAVLDSLLAMPGPPAPPSEPAPRLIRHLEKLLEFPHAGQVELLARGYAPGEWGPADPDARLPLAAALACKEAGLHPEALRWLDEGVLGSEDRAYRALLRIELCDAVGDSAGAVRTAFELVGRFPGEAWTLEAARRLLADKERHRDGAGLLAESLRLRRSLGRGPDEMAARCRALWMSDLPGAARGVCDSLLDSYPGTRTARIEALRRFREAPRIAAERSGRALLTVFIRNRLLDQAESLLVMMPKTADLDSLKVNLLEAFLQAKRYDRVLGATLVSKNRWSHDLRARWLLVRARAARNSGRWTEAGRLYRSAAALGGDVRRTALSEWGREAESLQKEAAADSIYTLLLEYPGSADEGRYRRALARFASGRMDDALADLRLVGPGEWAEEAAFWSYRVHEGRGDAEAGRAALRRASAGQGYHARRALAQLARADSTGPPGQARVGLDSDGVAGALGFWERLKTELFDFKEGDRSDTSRWAASIARTGPEGPNAFRTNTKVICGDSAPGEEARAARIRLFRRFGRDAWAEREQELLETELSVDRRAEKLLCVGLPDLSIRIAIAQGGRDRTLRYPRPFYAWVRSEADHAGIAPEMIWAVSRRESLFDPGAVSGAGARGLLQLMEGTANETARRHGIPGGPLSRADRNLSLGTLHLRDLAERGGWQVPAILAAYNAGAEKTAEWARRFPDPDLFVERIGWRETRDYVRSVLDAYWVYRSTYAPAGTGERDP